MTKVAIAGQLTIVQQTMETIDVHGSANMQKFLACVQCIARLKTELMSEGESEREHSNDEQGSNVSS